jgi:hypothetical protein
VDTHGTQPDDHVDVCVEFTFSRLTKREPHIDGSVKARVYANVDDRAVEPPTDVNDTVLPPTSETNTGGETGGQKALTCWKLMVETMQPVPH